MVGDVSGKGLGAALLMSSVLSSARVLYDTCERPLCSGAQAQRGRRPQRGSRHFVTMFLGLPRSRRPARCVTSTRAQSAAGHRRRRAYACWRTAGCRWALPTSPFEEGETDLRSGDLLAAFSDGILEATRGGEFFDDDRLRQALIELAGESEIDRISEGVVSLASRDFLAGEPRSDDVTLLLARRL